MMWDLYYRFFEIATWSKGPEDLPKSTFLFGLVTGVYAASALLLHFVSGTGYYIELIAVDLLLTSGLVGFVLFLRRVGHRLLQTLTAVLGTSTILHFVYLPPMVTLRQFDDTTMPGFLSSAAILVTVFWQWMILGHIFHRAITVDRLFGIVLAIVVWFISFDVLRSMYGSLSQGAGGV